MKRDTMLILDESGADREALCNLFRETYKILEAAGHSEVISMLKEHNRYISIMLLDLTIDNKTSRYELLRYLKEKDCLVNIPVILVTCNTDREEEIAAYDLGVSEVIKKPFDSYIIKRRVAILIDFFIHKNSLEALVKQQTETLQRQALKLKEMNNQVIETLSAVVEFRNLESGKHVKRIKIFTSVLLECAARLYKEYHLTEEMIQLISAAAAMHDVGKISIPDTILLKPGRLTKEEFEIMKLHTLHGCEIINSVAAKQEDDEYFRICYDIARHHHERYDGSGYPDKLAGDDIPFEAQIVAVADVYDALISERVYKEAYTSEQAYAMILNGDCGVFSSKVLCCFVEAREQLEAAAHLKEIYCP